MSRNVLRKSYCPCLLFVVIARHPRRHVSVECFECQFTQSFQQASQVDGDRYDTTEYSMNSYGLSLLFRRWVNRVTSGTRPQPGLIHHPHHRYSPARNVRLAKRRTWKPGRNWHQGWLD